MEKVFYQVSAGLSRATPTALVKKVRNCITMTTGNASFPTPSPTLASMATECDTLDAANQAYEFTRSKLEKDVRDRTYNILRDMLHEFSGYVQAASNGDRDKILSAGLNVRRTASAPEQLPAPENVRAEVTSYPGVLEVRWKGVKHRRIYALEYTAGDPNDAAGWKQLTMTTKNRHTATGLESNVVYHFRVVAFGALGASPVSDAASAKAA
jgi:hypothetical protein